MSWIARSIALLLLSLGLAACQTAGTAVSESNKSRIAAAGFVPWTGNLPSPPPGLSPDAVYVCPPPRCTPYAIVLLTTLRADLPPGLNMTMEEAIRSGAGKKVNLRQVLQNDEIRKGSNIVYESAAVDSRTMRVYLTARATGPMGKPFFMVGTLRLSGNLLIGGLSISENRASAYRYSSFAGAH